MSFGQPSNNTALGGIISNDKGKLIVTNSIFSDNTGRWGGAIYTYDGNVSIDNSSFTNNGEINNLSTGGAIQIDSGNVIITKSNFTNNIASWGGAIQSYQGIINISGSNFNENIAIYGGGAIKNDGVKRRTSLSFLSISNSTFTNNRVTNNSDDKFFSPGSGGAILNYGNVSIDNSSFINNTANSTGGAIQHAYCYILSATKISINNSIFTNNTAAESGGAISNNGKNYIRLVEISNSILTNNTAIRGGVIANNGNLTVIDSVFNNNKATLYGGAIYNLYGNSSIINTDFSNNMLTESLSEVPLGGAVYNYEGEVSIEDSTFDNNVAPWAGGAVYNNGNITISTNVFTFNTALYGGAVFNNENGLVNIENSNFRDNFVTGTNPNDNSGAYGGAINNYGGNLLVEYSIFTNNTAIGDYGGAGAIISSRGNTVIIKSNFTNNSGVYSGAIENDYGNLYILGSKFVNNNASTAGALMNFEGVLIVRNSSFMNNTAIQDAGAIVNTGNTSINNSRFINNKATEHAGAIANNGNLTINKSLFIHNIATYNGGAIANNGTLNITQSVINNNTGNLSIHDNETSTAFADANWWGNDTPIFTDLVNFDVGNYYVFLLEASANTAYPNEAVNLELIPVLNGTTDSSWTGPRIRLGDVKFNTTGNIKANQSKASFSAANVGVYTIKATSQYLTLPTTVVTVVKASESSVISVSVPGSVVYGNYFTIKVTLKSRGKLLAGQKVYVIYKGKTYKTGTTNTQGVATIKMPKLKIGTYTFTMKYNGNNNYQASNKITKKVKIVPLKITVTTPRNGQKGYSQTRTIIITFNQKIKKSTKYTRIYIKNLRTNRYTTLTKKIIGNKLYIKMKAKRYKRNYYRVYIPRYAVVNMYGKTISKARSIKFRT